MMHALSNRRAPEKRSPLQRDENVCIHCHNDYLSTFNVEIPSTPFQDYECEKCVIGAILINEPEMTDLAMRRMRSHWFGHPRHGDIFSAIQTLWQERHVDGEIVCIDLVTVMNQMHKMGLVGDRYSVNYVVSCIESCPSAANMNAYLKILEECMQRRQLHELGIALRQHSAEPETRRRDVSAAQLINAARRALDAIEYGGSLDINLLLETK